MTRIVASKWHLAFASVVAAILLNGPAWSAKTKEEESRDSEARMKTDVFFLASAKCEGRGPTTKGIEVAADHIAAEFEKAGLKRGMKDSYFQPFSLPAAKGKVAFVGPDKKILTFTQGKDFNPLCRNQKG